MPAVSSMRALVVDDNYDAASALAILLKHCGHQTEVVTGGEAALEKAPSYHPDVIFIDLAMPQVDGFSVARQLRQNVEFAETPLVAISGYVDAEHRAKAEAAGFTDFLAKPFPLVAVQETLKRAAERIHAARKLAVKARLVAEQSRQLNEAARRDLNDFWQRLRRSVASIPVAIQKSGISEVLTLAERSAAEELRRWLREQRCRVGPVFESDGEQFSFFVYSRKHAIRELVAQHGKFKVS